MTLRQLVGNSPRRTRLVMALLILLMSGLGVVGCEAIENLIRGISDGAECEQDENCVGGTCLTNFPGGYCTTLNCETEGCSNIFGSQCLVINEVGTAAICYEVCNRTTDCRTGYSCVDTDGARVCLPDSLAEILPRAGENGTSCARDETCLGGTCMQNFTGGYCTRANCTSDTECDNFGDGQCLDIGSESSEFLVCLDGCQGDGECRFGYGCFDRGGSGVCDLLDDANPVRNPNGADDGQPCAVDINCKGGTCLSDVEGYSGGYCTTLNCNLVGCNDDTSAQCRTFENDAACFLNCDSNTDCRDGYECLAGGYCAPPLNTTTPTDSTGTLNIVCESEATSAGRRFDFNIDASTESFAITAFSNAAPLRPRRLILPDGSIGADFNTDYAFHDLNSELLINLAPTFFPAAPQFLEITSQGGGMYSLEVETTDSDPCFFLLEKPSQGSQITLNMYLVGVPSVTPQTAPNDPNMQQMLDAFEQIFNAAGIQLQQVRYFALDQTSTDRFSIIRDFNETFELLSESTNPGTTLGELLSVNVFLIQDFAISQAPGLLGFSAGLPGVPALHGNHGAGLVFTSSPLGFDNVALGQTMAHEVGHYLGLRHTSEAGGGGDPLSDTPQCSNPDDGAGCPDATNFMFPFSLGGVSQVVVTDQQEDVLRWSPLVQ